MMTGSGSAVFGLFPDGTGSRHASLRESILPERKAFRISLVSRARYRAMWWRALDRAHYRESMAAPKPIRAMSHDRLQMFTGQRQPGAGQEICQHLDMQLGDAMVRQFADGEIYLQIQENVRGADVFVIQPTCTPVDRNLMELLLMMDALKRASAERITAVLPYYGYARQDRKDKPRVPISAKLVAALLETAGADRVLTLDLHAAQIQGFFDIPVDHLFASPVMIEYFKAQNAAGRDGGFAGRRRRGAGAGVRQAAECAAGDYR